MKDAICPLDWCHAINEIGARGLERERTASAAELAAIAEALELEACSSLHVRYRIRPLRSECYRLTGAIGAEVVQTCVVTLEPVAARIDETFDVEFHHEAIAPEIDVELEILTAPEIEQVEHQSIAVGRIAYETLAAALNPYPRKPGAQFDWSDPKAGTAADHPFAALRNLKKPAS